MTNKKFNAKVKKYWNKAKETGRGVNRAINAYGPRVNRGLSNMAMNIQQGFAPPSPRVKEFNAISPIKRRKKPKRLPKGWGIY